MPSGYLTSQFESGRIRNSQSSQFEAGKRKRSRHPEVYSVTDPQDFLLERFAEPGNLYLAYRQLEQYGGPGTGLDGLTFADFSPREVYEMLRAISGAIKSKNYRPYAALEVKIPKANGKFRTLSLPQLADRTVSKALLICLDPYWRPLLPGIGRDVWRTYALMEQIMRQKKAYILAIDDVHDCYPSICIDTVLGCHAQYINQPDLLWLVEQVIRGQDGPEHAIGLAQGSPYSPVAMELTLQHCLDAELEATHPGYTQLRYVDNITYICSSVGEGEEILKTAGRILGKHGLTLKGKDGNPQDIRDPEHNRSVLGLIPRWEDGQLKLAIPEQSVEDLREGFQLANETPKATEVARQVAYGWISALGPTLTNTVRSEVVERVLSIARECSFREIPHQETMKKAQAARERWIKLKKSYG